MNVRPKFRWIHCAFGGLVLGGATALLLFGNFNTENEPRMSDAVAIAYVITDYTDATNPREIASGTKSYSSPSVQVEQRGDGKKTFLSESIELADGYRVGASIYRENRIDGFGLWAKRDKQSFSWEWFYQLEGDEFKKLQESGNVRVLFRNMRGLQQLASIIFESDVSLRMNQSSEIGKVTHRILIKKGSVFEFPK